MIAHLNKNSLASEAANKDPQTATTTFSPHDLLLLNSMICGKINVLCYANVTYEKGK